MLAFLNAQGGYNWYKGIKKEIRFIEHISNVLEYSCIDICVITFLNMY